MKTILGKALMSLVIAALFLPCGCGGEGGSPTSPAATNADGAAKKGGIIAPCALITKKEAGEILGETLKDPEMKDSNPLGQKICFFPSGAEGSFTFLQISVIQTAAMPTRVKSSGMNAAKIYQGTKENMTETKEVTGIGQEAFWGTLGLHILTGDTYIVISVGPSSKPANLEKAKKIAELILKRLLVKSANRVCATLLRLS
jgi:hypothetical protein